MHGLQRTCNLESVILSEPTIRSLNNMNSSISCKPGQQLLKLTQQHLSIYIYIVPLHCSGRYGSHT